MEKKKKKTSGFGLLRMCVESLSAIERVIKKKGGKAARTRAEISYPVYGKVKGRNSEERKEKKNLQAVLLFFSPLFFLFTKRFKCSLHL